MADVIGEGTFEVGDFDKELDAARRGHRQLGTRVLFENDRIRVWEVRLAPGERGAFHLHDRHYVWTVVDGGVGLQRSDDGTYKLRRYHVGDTSYQDNTAEDPMIHDFENAGDAEIRFVTTELLD
jgi:quercetin dioxygenase-like cupin family protein